MRQVGKTTLMRALVRTFISLDDDRIVTRFRGGDFSRLDAPGVPLGIDECQKVAGMFDAIKLRIDDRKQMGRYLLSGSVRFLSKRNIRESLTGRTQILELLPMSLSETHDRQQKDLLKILRSATFAQAERAFQLIGNTPQVQIENYLICGGMPGICFKRDNRLRFDLYDVHLETLLSRDLSMLYASRVAPSRLRELLRLIAIHEGEPISNEELARKVGVSPPTIKALLDAFQALYLVRVVGKNTYFIEDLGLSNYLVPVDLKSRRQTMLSFVFHELLALIHYRYHRSVAIVPYRTRGGAEVPFTVRSPQFKIDAAITVDPDSLPSEKSLKSLQSYAKRQPKARLVALHAGTDAYMTSRGVWCIPIARAF
jgi:predicted AAA+ superfamily ATPase